MLYIEWFINQATSNTCGTVNIGKNKAILQDFVVSLSTIISVQSVDTPVIKNAKLLPGAAARLSKSAAIGAQPSE